MTVGRVFTLLLSALFITGTTAAPRLQSPTFYDGSPFNVTLSFSSPVPVQAFGSGTSNLTLNGATYALAEDQYFPTPDGVDASTVAFSIIVLVLTPVEPFATIRAQIPAAIAPSGQTSSLKRINYIEGGTGASIGLTITGPTVHNGPNPPWGVHPLDVFFTFTSPVSVADFAFDDIVLVNAKHVFARRLLLDHHSTEHSHQHKHGVAAAGEHDCGAIVLYPDGTDSAGDDDDDGVVHHMDGHAHGRRLQAQHNSFILTILPTANANITIHVGKDMVRSPGNTAASLVIAYAAPPPGSYPAVPTILAPPYHTAENFDVVVEFDKPNPAFTEDFVRAQAASLVFPPVEGSFAQFPPNQTSRYKMSFRPFVLYTMFIDVRAVPDPANPGRILSTNASRLVRYSPFYADAPEVLAPATHTMEPFEVDINFDAAVPGFSAANLVITDGNGRVNGSLVSPSAGSYTGTIIPTANGTITLQVRDELNFPPVFAPTDYHHVYYVAPNANPVNVTTDVATPLVHNGLEPILVIVTFSGPVQGFHRDDITFTGALEADQHWYYESSAQYALLFHPTAPPLAEDVTFSVGAGVVVHPNNLASTSRTVTYVPPSPTPTATATPSASATASLTASASATASATSSVSATATSTPTPTPSQTGSASATPSGTPSVTPTTSGTSSLTPTPSVTPSTTGSGTRTPSTTSSRTPSSTRTPSSGASTTPSASSTPVPVVAPSPLPPNVCDIITCDHGTCVEATKSCDCDDGWTLFDCSQAVPAGQTSHCFNGVQDAGETDIDCGGPCAPCSSGFQCILNTDCDASTSCSADNVCTPSTTYHASMFVRAVLVLNGAHKSLFVDDRVSSGVRSTLAELATDASVSGETYVGSDVILADVADSSTPTTNATTLTVLVNLRSNADAPRVTDVLNNPAALQILITRHVPGIGSSGVAVQSVASGIAPSPSPRPGGGGGKTPVLAIALASVVVGLVIGLGVMCFIMRRSGGTAAKPTAVPIRSPVYQRGRTGTDVEMHAFSPRTGTVGVVETRNPVDVYADASKAEPSATWTTNAAALAAAEEGTMSAIPPPPGMRAGPAAIPPPPGVSRKMDAGTVVGGVSTSNPVLGMNRPSANTRRASFMPTPSRQRASIPSVSSISAGVTAASSPGGAVDSPHANVIVDAEEEELAAAAAAAASLHTGVRPSSTLPGELGDDPKADDDDDDNVGGGGGGPATTAAAIPVVSRGRAGSRQAIPNRSRSQSRGRAPSQSREGRGRAGSQPAPGLVTTSNPVFSGIAPPPIPSSTTAAPTTTTTSPPTVPDVAPNDPGPHTTINPFQVASGAAAQPSAPSSPPDDGASPVPGAVEDPVEPGTVVTANPALVAALAAADAAAAGTSDSQPADDGGVEEWRLEGSTSRRR